MMQRKWTRNAWVGDICHVRLGGQRALWQDDILSQDLKEMKSELCGHLGKAIWRQERQHLQGGREQ